MNSQIKPDPRIDALHEHIETQARERIEHELRDIESQIATWLIAGYCMNELSVVQVIGPNGNIGPKISFPKAWLEKLQTDSERLVFDKSWCD